MTHALQQQRYELKYLIPESLTIEIRDFISPYLVLDAFAKPYPDCSYDIHSIYMDSADLETYHSSLNGDKNRYKLRLRFYNDDPKSPAFFEVKRRKGDIILKSRCGVKRAAIPIIMAGHLPELGLTLAKTPKDTDALEQFCRMMASINARPISHVAYSREAWVSELDNSVRVTMDRNVRSEPQSDTNLHTSMANPNAVFGKEVILELKFTNRFPNWFGELVRAFGLMQCGGAKYVGGILLRGEEQFRNKQELSWEERPSANPGSDPKDVFPSK